MGSRTKKEVDEATCNIHSDRMNTSGESMFKYNNTAWGTLAFEIRRSALEDKSVQFFDKELYSNGIYFLVGRDDETFTEKIYVGQAKLRNNGDSIIARLREHVSTEAEIKEKYFHHWNRAIVITSKDTTDDNGWGPTQLNMIESIMESKIPAENNSNGNHPNSGGGDPIKYAEIIRTIELYLAFANVRVFRGIDEEQNLKYVGESDIPNRAVEDISPESRIPEIVTPVKVVKAMVDMLPAEVWNDKTVFLDPACKGGEYLREIYDRLMDNEYMKAKYPSLIARSNHILSEQIYGIALSEQSKSRTTSLLEGFGQNIRIIPDYISILKVQSKYSNKELKKSHCDISSIINEEFNKDMKIDVVIGNPPYQENDGSGLDGGSALYDKFMRIGSDLADITSMIVPMRWMIQYRVKGINQDWVKKELHCNQYKNLMYDDESKNIFRGVNIRGGVMYFLKNNKYNGKCKVGTIGGGNTTIVDRYLASSDDIDVFITDNTEESILSKVHSKETFDSIVGSTNEFGIESNTVTTGTGLTLYRSFGEIDSCGLNEIHKGTQYIPLYKVIIGRTFGTGKKGERLPVPRIIGPNEICSGSLLAIGKSTNKTYCENVAKYIQTKFMALLVGMRKSTHHATKEAYMFVPLQDFTSNSDIDWSQSIEQIDQQLYKKYNLTQEEINYIESTIKPMQ